jgi:ectoine hydroxylase-related dioxygenase (phytanoyl-CoA dioxygenase family)
MESVAHLVDEIINGKGYVVIPEVLSSTQAETARSTVLKLAEETREWGQVMSQGQRERVYSLVYKGEIFELMVQHPTVIKIVEAIVGWDMTLGGFSAHVLHPGAMSMGVHVDYPYWTMEPPFPTHPALEVQVIWMVEDFTEENGAPVFLPGSQKLGKLPNLTHFSKTAKKITGKAGSLVLSHGLCWHDTSVNSTQKPRVSILGNYNPKFVRPLEDPSQGLQKEVVERATHKLRQLLGYDFKATLIKDIQRLQRLYEQSF